MKTINYTGNSKLIARIVHLLNRKAPIPLDGDGDAEWGTNGQVLTTDGNGNTYWGDGGGDVTDVEVNGTSVVNAQGVAEVSVPTATSDLTNDSGFIDGTDLATALADYTPTANLATVATSGDYDDLLNKPSIPAAQVQSDWTQADNTQVDYIKNKPSLATVATSGSYTDLTDKPTIPTALADLTDDSTHRVVTDTQISTWNGKSDFSGSYNDLTDKPTIPTVNDGTLTIQQNGTTVGTFTANQSGNTTVNLTGGGSTYTEGDGIDITNDEISVDTTFTEASTRTNIASGESFATILGKIKKFFTDLKTVAFSGSYNDLSDKPTIPDISTKVSKSGDTMTGTLGIGTGAGAASAGTPMAISYPRIQCYGTLYINGDTDGSKSEYVLITSGRGVSSTLADGLAVGYSTLQWQGQDVIHSGNIGSQSVNYANSAGSVTNYGNRSLTVTDNDGSTVVGFLGTANQIIDLRNKLDKTGDTITGIIGIGASSAGGYLNGSATNGGCNSILVGDDAWLGDVNQGGTVGVKSANSTSAGFHFYGSDGGDYGVLKAEPSCTYVDRAFRVTGNNQLQFAGDDVVIYRDSNSWLDIKSNNGNAYRATYHDFKNSANSAWVSISAGGFVTQSSKRYKENIEDMTEEEAKKILDVRAVSFDYKDGVRDEDRNKFGQHGVIAEEVNETIPEVVTYAHLVREDPESELVPDSVDYAKFVPYLIKMVQIQQKEIDVLKAIVKATITETATE